jgi:hypothetical protein
LVGAHRLDRDVAWTGGAGSTRGQNRAHGVDYTGQLVGPSDGLIGPSPNVMNRMCILTNFYI